MLCAIDDVEIPHECHGFATWTFRSETVVWPVCEGVAELIVADPPTTGDWNLAPMATRQPTMAGKGGRDA